MIVSDRSAYLVTFLIMMSLVALPVYAEIYKYQDEEGHWHFTDKPGAGVAVTDEKKEAERKDPGISDLEDKLSNVFSPRTPVEVATLAVVAIDTPLVQGSGFFITRHGHILTNKHVVRPTETDEWKEREDALKEADREYRKAGKILREERNRLDTLEKALREYKEAIDKADDDYAKRIAEAEYRMFMDRHQRHRKEYGEVKKEYTEKKRIYEKERRELNFLSSTSVLSRKFRIILKDDEKLDARLITVSKDHDLALLKIDRHKTPYIRPGDFNALQHGMKVYAVGSPLGMKDVITSGIVAGIKDENVITDATILPGSSGGPLLTEKGEVIGVNSLRVSQVIGGEGFGVAISIEHALSEFGEHIGSN